MKFLMLSVILLSNVLVGCQSNVLYVVARPVPDEPKIVVIPASDYLSEVEYANKIEQLLFKYNILISSRPSKKYIEITDEDIKSAISSQSKFTGVGAQLLGGRKGSKINKTEKEDLQRYKRESYLSFSDINADYIIRSSRRDRSLKLYKRQSRELLGYMWQLEPTYKRLGRFLYTAGISRLKIEKQENAPPPTVKIEYMSRDDIRETPVFTFIPANYFSKEIQFSNYCERLFFEYGVKIVRRPGLKKVEKFDIDRKNVIKQKQGRTTEAGQIGSGKNIKQFYYEYEKIDADYFVTTYSKSKQVRIVKKSDNTVVSLFNLKNWNPGLLGRLADQSNPDLSTLKINMEQLQAVGSKIQKVRKSGSY